MRIRNLVLSTILVSSLGLVGCSQDYGKTVEQGRAVAFGNGEVTFIKDVNVNPKAHANYVNEVRKFKLPADPKEIGPEPVIGNLIDVDIAKKEIKVFKDGALKTVPVDLKAEVNVESHSDKVKGKKFPVLEGDSVTVYAKKALISFKVPSEFSAETRDFWVFGDVVRVFSKKHDGVANRFMNVTKTNIFKK